MSRTDKDRPEWVRSADPTVASVEVHRCVPKSPWVSGVVECDIDSGRDARCYRREAKSERDWVTSVPRWFIKTVWTGPDRTRVRMAARAAATDFRANGEIEIEIPIDQHRHRAQWQWW